MTWPYSLLIVLQPTSLGALYGLSILVQAISYRYTDLSCWLIELCIDIYCPVSDDLGWNSDLYIVQGQGWGGEKKILVRKHRVPEFASRRVSVRAALCSHSW